MCLSYHFYRNTLQLADHICTLSLQILQATAVLVSPISLGYSVVYIHKCHFLKKSVTLMELCSNVLFFRMVYAVCISRND